MTDTQKDEHFGQKQVRKAEFIKPPNHIKNKVGSGGIPAHILKKAEEQIENNTVDFRPLATDQISLLTEAVRAAKEDTLENESVIEGIVFPAMQLKAHGTMFHYPTITDVAGVLVRFLESLKELDKESLQIVSAHENALKSILQSELKDNTTTQSRAITDELLGACDRYFNKYPDAKAEE